MKRLAALLCIVFFVTSVAFADSLTPTNFQEKYDACCDAFGNTEIGSTEQKKQEVQAKDGNLTYCYYYVKTNTTVGFYMDSRGKITISQIKCSNAAEHSEFLSACACLITAYHGARNLSDAYAALLQHYFMCKTGKSDSNEPYVMSDYTAFIMRRDAKGTYTFSISK